MASCSGHFQGSFDVLLSANVREIKVEIILMLKEFPARVNDNGLALRLSVKKRYDVSHAVHAVNVKLIHNSRLAGIGCGHDKALVMFEPCLDGNRQYTLDGLKLSVKPQLAYHHKAAKSL